MNLISLHRVKTVLVVIWATGFFLTFLIFFLLSFKRFNGINQEAWGWLIPNILPTFVMLLGSMNKEESLKRETSKVYFRITAIISCFYFLVLILIIFGFVDDGQNIIDYYNSKGVILGPLQALIAATIGYICNKGESLKKIQQE